MNIDQMSERLQKILMDAINLAKSNQHPSVDTVDMLETIFKDDVLDGLVLSVSAWIKVVLYRWFNKNLIVSQRAQQVI